MPSGYAYGKSFRTVKTCVGQDFCRFGVGDSTTLGIAIEKRFQGIEGPAKMKLAVTGCPRNCAEAYVKDLGVVAIDGGRWEIYVGGAAGAHVRKGDLLATVDAAEMVSCSPGGSCSTTGRTPTGWSGPTRSCPGSASSRSARSWSTTAEGIAAELDAAVAEPRPLPGPVEGRANRPPRASSAPRCRWRAAAGAGRAGGRCWAVLMTTG